MSEPAMVVEASGLGAWIGGREALRGVDLSVGPGERVALVGANGAGKTTLLRVLATLLAAGAGSLRLFGRPARPGGSEARSRLGMIAHQPMLYEDLTVRENLELFARLHRAPAPRQRAAELLVMAGLTDRADERAGSLSRGQAQRAAIARALVHEPELLLADEPWTGLDAEAAGVFDRVLERWRDAGRTVIVATHDLRRALAVAERVVGLREGRVVLDQAAGRVELATLASTLGLPEREG